MRREAWHSIGAVMLALLLVCGAIIFSPPRQSTDVQIVTVGDRWLDLLGRDFRVFDLDGNTRGEFWLGKSRVRRIDIEFSPNGRWVWIREIESQDWSWRWTLFRSDDLSSPIYTLTGVYAVSWSSNGTKMAITRVDDTDATSIWIADVVCLLEDSACVPEEKLFATAAWEPDWSPDDTRIAYTTESSAIVIANIATGQTVRPAEDDYLGCHQIRWSPTGRFLALDCPDRLLIYNFEIDAVIDLFIDGVEDHDWLPGQDILVFLTCYPTEGLCKSPVPWNHEAQMTNALYSLDVTTGQRVRLTPGNSDSFQMFAIWPASDN